MEVFFALFVMLAIIGAIVGTEGDNDISTVKIVPDATSTVGATAAESPSRISTAAPTPTLIPTTTPSPTPFPTATPTPVPIQMELVEFLDEYDQNKVPPPIPGCDTNRTEEFLCPLPAMWMR